MKKLPEISENVIFIITFILSILAIFAIFGEVTGLADTFISSI